MSRLNGNLWDFKYTMPDSSHVNRTIASQVAEISERTLAEVKDVISLFLLGGYGRGEGSVIRNSEGIIPLGDYDFLVVSKFPHIALSISGLEFLQKKFRVQYHIDVDYIWKFLLPIVDKRIYWYEVKFGSKLLFGDKKVLDLIPIRDNEDINLSEGFSLMFNRLMGSLKHFDPKFCEFGVTKEQSKHLIFQSVKAILACGESLLLLSGKYHFSYAERCRRFSKNFEIDFPELVLSTPSLREDYEKATHFKLKPNFSMYNDPVRFWFRANRHLLQTALFFMEKTMLGSNNSSTRCYAQKELRAFPRLFLQASKPQLLDFLIFNWHTISRLRSLEGFQTRRSFSDIVRASLFDLALSIDEDGEINQELLDRALRRISKIITICNQVINQKDLSKKWRLVRNATMLAWTMVRH